MLLTHVEVWPDEGLEAGACGAGVADLGVAKSAYKAPFSFTGGTIREVVVGVGGNPYVDIELEAMAMMKRD